MNVWMNWLKWVHPDRRFVETGPGTEQRGLIWTEGLNLQRQQFERWPTIKSLPIFSICLVWGALICINSEWGFNPQCYSYYINKILEYHSETQFELYVLYLKISHRGLRSALSYFKLLYMVNGTCYTINTLNAQMKKNVTDRIKPTFIWGNTFLSYLHIPPFVRNIRPGLELCLQTLQPHPLRAAALRTKPPAESPRRKEQRLHRDKNDSMKRGWSWRAVTEPLRLSSRSSAGLFTAMSAPLAPAPRSRSSSTRTEPEECVEMETRLFILWLVETWQQQRPQDWNSHSNQ